MNPEIVSFQYATGMCLLLENVGVSEQNRSVIANVQSDDLWPSRMHAAVLSTGQWRRRRGSAGCSPCVNEAPLQVVGVADRHLVHMFLHPTPDPVVDRV